MKKQVIVTTSWDDSHKLDLKLAKLLKKYGIKGTFYIAPKNREFSGNCLLSGKDILYLSRDFEIGAHTLTHPRLSTINITEAKMEIEESKHYLERLLNKSIVSFCYPGGDYTNKNIHQVRKAGFHLARTTKQFYLNFASDWYKLPASIHATNHWLDVWSIALFVRFNPLKFIRYYRHWDLLATAMFDRVMRCDGIFHLWGHSWEIERHNDWGRLEKVLMYISHRKGVSYMTNGELV